jgi:Contractile injection system tube protein
MPSKKGGGGGGGLYTETGWGPTLFQAPFDKRILSIPDFTDSKPVQAGRIVVQPGNKVTYGDADNLGLRFLYNPSEIAVNYSPDMEYAPPPASTVDPNARGNFMGATGSLSFAILFDRTYETWNQSLNPGQNPGGYDVQQYGCYVDVRQLYLMFGMLMQSTKGSGGSGQTAGSHGTVGHEGAVGQNPLRVDNYELQTSPMIPTPIQVYFGDKKSLTFYGRCTGFNVTYTHFTRAMTPNRCVVNLSMESLIKKSAIKGKNGGGGGGGGSEDATSDTNTTGSSTGGTSVGRGGGVGPSTTP